MSAAPASGAPNAPPARAALGVYSLGRDARAALAGAAPEQELSGASKHYGQSVSQVRYLGLLGTFARWPPTRLR